VSRPRHRARHVHASSPHRRPPSCAATPARALINAICPSNSTAAPLRYSLDAHGPQPAAPTQADRLAVVAVVALDGLTTHTRLGLTDAPRSGAGLPWRPSSALARETRSPCRPLATAPGAQPCAARRAAGASARVAYYPLWRVEETRAGADAPRADVPSSKCGSRAVLHDGDTALRSGRGRIFAVVRLHALALGTWVVVACESGLP